MANEPARDPQLLELLDGRTPAMVTDEVWARPMRISAYLGAAELPDHLVTGVRCLVMVDDQIVVCTTVQGRIHVWPGGRCEPGESHVETACREVHEETGWHLDPESLRPIGFFHLQNMGEPQPPYPHPDVLQLVVTGSATECEAPDWADTEGWEVSSRLAPLHEALDLVRAKEPMCVPFLQHLTAES